MLWARLRGLFARQGAARIDEEIAGHISLMAAEYERRGMTPERAHLEARRQFGGVTQVRESYREQQGFPLIDSFLQDLTYGLRQLRKSPLFAGAAVLTLTLGIGANTAVFRVLDVLVLRSLPVRNADQLVVLQAREFGKPASFTFQTYRELTKQQDVLRDWFAAGDVWQSKVSLEGGAELQTNRGRLVTGGYFPILGMNAALGRLLSEADDRPGAPPVAVISYKMWDQAFGRSPAVIGRLLKIKSATATVVGVAPRRFEGERVLFQVDLWLPMSMQPSLQGVDWLNGSFSFLDVMGRLKPGISLRQAQAALDPQYQRLLGQEPGRDRLEVRPARHGITLEQLQDAVVGPLGVLMWMVAAVLAIACCNLANLLLAKGAARTHEIGVRLALGAGRGRLVRQLLTESLLLAILGTAAGFVLAEWGTRFLIVQVDQDLDVGVDFGWRVLGFVGVVSAAATCLFGVAPALAGTRLDVRCALQGSWGGRPRQRLGKALVVAQVSICLMLLSGAALLMRTVWNLERQDWGFRAQGLLIADLPVDMAQDLVAERSQKLFAERRAIYDKMNAIAGVRSAALATGGPLSNNSWSADISVPGRKARNGDYAREVRVSPRYFETMGIRILEGRGIGEGDGAKAPKVVVLSRTAARRIFDGTNPIGRYISTSKEFSEGEALQVVGVVNDVRLASPREEPGVVVFTPLEQQDAKESLPFNSVVLRTEGDPAAMAPAVRKALGEVSHDRSVGAIQAVTEILSDQLDNEQTLAAVAASLGVLAMVMAAVGLYGVISYAVARRTQEMGIRLALGASAGQVAGLVMREVGLLLVAGLVAGSLGAVICGRLVRSLLYGITVQDSLWLVLAGLAMAAAAAVAGYLPARRAGRLSPLDALRQE